VSKEANQILQFSQILYHDLFTAYEVVYFKETFFSKIPELTQFLGCHISLPTRAISYTAVTNYLSPEIPPCRCCLKYINELAEKIINAQLKARGYRGAKLGFHKIAS